MHRGVGPSLFHGCSSLGERGEIHKRSHVSVLVTQQLCYHGKVLLDHRTFTKHPVLEELLNS